MSGDGTAATGAALLEERMQTTFGMSHREYVVERNGGRVPRAYLGNAIRIVQRSGVLPKLQEWQQAARKSNAGAKPIIPLSAVLMLFLLNVQMGFGVTYNQIARTLDTRLGKEELALLGIRDVHGNHDDWYQRVWQAANRMLALIDPLPAPRDRKLTSEEYGQLLRQMETSEAIALSKRNLDRIDWLCNQLVEASVRMLPEDIWKKYKGNISIDATRGEIAGRPNPTEDSRSRSNADPLSRRYRREDIHNGMGAKTDVAAYELEKAVMAWNAPGENTSFPSLVTAVSFHNPGQLTGHGVKLIKRHQQLGFHRILVMADRAYNGEAIENFHIPARLLGCELVVDYKSTELGVQGHFADLILVDGNWYVDWIPEDLITATTDLPRLDKGVSNARGVLIAAAKRKTPPTDDQLSEIAIAKETIADAPNVAAKALKRVENRAPYRMVPKGFPDKDGFQRFSYPTGGDDLVQPGSALARKTITVPMLIPEESSQAKKSRKTQPVKFLQKFPYRTALWASHYGMRSLVESSNSLFKSVDAEDIGNPAKRSGRGYAFHYLAMTLAAASSNLRRILTFFEAEAKRNAGGSWRRSRYRKDPHGNPLSQPKKPAALAPPR